jgi:hypothetical protein
MGSGRARALFRQGFEGVLVEYWREIMTGTIIFSILAGTISAWSAAKGGGDLAVFAGGMSALAAGLAAATGLLRAVEQRTYESKQNRFRQALDMLREWNQHTAAARSTLEKALPGLYDTCKRLTREEAAHLYPGLRTSSPAGAPSSGDPTSYDRLSGANAEHIAQVREHIVGLLNYFEYVSSAYLKHAADREILRESFAGTMVRYYCILGEFVACEEEVTGRNPWTPYTQFVETMLAERKARRIDDLKLGFRACLSPEVDRLVCASELTGCVWRGHDLRVLLSTSRMLRPHLDDDAV